MPMKVNIQYPPIEASCDVLDSVFQTINRWIETLPLFLELDLDLSELLKQARRFRLFKDVIVLGVGGSCLGGKLLANFKPTGNPHMHFIDNIDPSSWNTLMKNLDLTQTGVVAFSKSGNTTETLCQVLTLLQAYQGLSLSDAFLFVSDPGESALREVSLSYQIPCLDHPIGIGGRFSVFTVVGLLPALISGIDTPKILEGARSCVQNFVQTGPVLENTPLKSAIFFDQAFKKKYNTMVQFCYADRLLHFAAWYNQLWAESLGKRSLLDENVRYGMTPLTAIGTVDQHSQLQLYIDGPQDKVFNFFTLGDHPTTPQIDQSSLLSPVIRAINGHTLAELMTAHQNVTMQTLLQNQAMVRRIHIPILDEFALGELLVSSILEVLATGCLWNINPFDQPGVKNGKERVLEIMRNDRE